MFFLVLACYFTRTLQRTNDPPTFPLPHAIPFESPQIARE